MKKIMIIGGLALACATAAPAQEATRWAIKGYDNLGLGKCMSITGDMEENARSSNFNAFGIDVGYTFWRSGKHSLEANLGLGYSTASTTFGIESMSYHYSSPAIGDEDGNLYERYYELSDLSQHVSVSYFSIPIYCEYQYRALPWLGLHAEAGFGLDFRTRSAVGKMSGSARAWGVFPEYDDLLIDEDYLDDFGTRYLSKASVDKPSAKGFGATFMCGAGFEFYAYEPVSFELGVRYNVGLTHAFDGKYAGSKGEGGGSGYTFETAPVFYTVKDGTQVRSLTDYNSGSRLSALSLHMGVTVRF